MITKSTAVLFIIILFVHNVNAQTQDKRDNIADTSQTLNEIIIQWSRLQIPFSKQNRNITIIDQKVIQALPVKSVNELLQYVAGIDVRQRGPRGVQADISIDGGTFDETLVLLNGIKVTDPQTGHNMMNLPVSTLAIERIEILKGAAARIYGVNALNGAINIITLQPRYTGIDMDIHSGSSFQKDTSTGKLFAGYGVDVTAGIHGKKINQFISASQNHSSGYRYNTAFDNQRVFYQNTIAAGSENKVNVMAGYVNNDFGANAFYAAPADMESKEHVETAIAAITSVLNINANWIFRPRLSYRYNKDDYIFKRHNPSYYRNIHQTNVWDLELNNTIKSKVGDFGLGLEIRGEAINSNSLGKRSRMNYGFFGEYSFNKVEKLLVNAGAYINYNSDFGWEVLPGIDAGYDVTNKIRLFVNAGAGQRLPTFTDLYYKGPSNIGNPELIPEESFHSEAGLKYNDASLNVSLSYFHKNVSEFIDWVKNDISDPWQPENFQRIKTDGISFSSDYRITDNEVSAFSWLTGLSFTWLSPRIESAHPEMISHYALNNLRNQAVVFSNISYRDKYHFTLTARYQQRIQYKDYFLLDAKAGVSLSGFDIYIEANNLTNVTYVEAGAVPMPGRWATLGLKWNWRRK